MRQKKQLATWAQRKKRVYQINVHAICWDCFEWANIQPAVLHPIKPSCDAIESSHRIICVRWWFLTFPLYLRLYRRVKKSATDSFCTQQKYARQPTNINLSMIYCVFNTVFERIILCLVYWVFDCVRFAKHEPKHSQTHTPHNIIPPMSNSSIALNVISIARKQFFFRLLLCFHLRFSRPFLTTFNHLCLLNFPFRAQDLPYGKIERKCSLLIQFPCIQSPTN